MIIRRLLYLLIFMLLLLVGAISQCVAQVKITSITFGTSYIPASRYIRPTDSVKTKFTSEQHHSWLDVGISLTNKFDTATGKVRMLTANLRGSYTRLNNKLYTDDVFPGTLLATDFGIQYYRSLHNRWSYSVFASIGVNSDLKHVSSNDIFASGGIIFIKSFRPNLSVGFGLIAHNSFGTILPWPALTVRWQMGSRYKLQINVPDNGIGLLYNVGVSYATSRSHHFTLAFRPRQISYDVQLHQLNNRLASYWELPIGPESRWKLAGMELFAGGGLMALRSFQYGEKNISKMFEKYPAHRLAANLFVNAGVQIRF